MKKLLAIVALIAFLGGMSAPVIANDNVVIETLADKDPKKAKSSDCSATAEKSSDRTAAAEKSAGDCNATAKKNSSDCNATAKKKSSNCSTATAQK